MMAHFEAWLRATSSAAVDFYKYSYYDRKIFERKETQIQPDSGRIGSHSQHHS